MRFALLSVVWLCVVGLAIDSSECAAPDAFVAGALEPVELDPGFRRSRRFFGGEEAFAPQASQKKAKSLTLAFDCPTGSTSRPTTFTACGSGISGTEVVGAIMNEDLDYLEFGVTDSHPSPWKISFTNLPTKNDVFVRVETIGEPYEMMDSSLFSVVSSGGTACDCDKAKDSGKKPPVQKLAKSYRPSIDMDTVKPIHFHQVDDFVVRGTKPANRNVYGIVIHLDGKAKRKTIYKKQKTDPVGAMNYEISFGKLPKGTYLVRVRYNKKDDSAWNQAVTRVIGAADEAP